MVVTTELRDKPHHLLVEEVTVFSPFVLLVYSVARLMVMAIFTSMMVSAN